MTIDLASLIATALNGLLVAGLGASVTLLWRTSVLLAGVQTAQTAHEKADIERFATLNQRLEDFRSEFRESWREPH